jgi:hypothetical protein
MSKSGVIGAVGIHSQSAKGSAAGTLAYVPSTSVNLNTLQNTQALPRKSWDRTSFAAHTRLAQPFPVI